MVILQSAFTLPVPVDEAFDLLVDPEAVAASLPGARPTEPGAAEGELDVDAGFATVTVRGHVQPDERDRQAGSLTFHALGEEVEGGAEVRAGGAVRLRDAGGITAVAIQLEVDAGGRLAAGGPSGVESTMRRIVDAFAAGLRAQVTGDAGEQVEEVDGDGELRGEADEAVGYGWMVGAADAASRATREEMAVPVAATATATSTPPRDAASSASPAAHTASPRQPRSVPGRVEIVTNGPVPVAGLPVGDSPAARIHALHRSRPWLIPAVLLGLIALALLLRRRSD